MPIVQSQWITTLNVNDDFPTGFLYLNGYLYACFAVAPSVVCQVDASTGNEIARATMSGTSATHGDASDLLYIPSKGKLYTISGTNQITITEIDPVTLSFTDVVTRPPFFRGVNSSITADGTYLYIGSFDNGVVYRYLLADWSAQGSVTPTIPGGSTPALHCIRYDPVSAKVYALGQNLTGPGCIVRIDPVTFTQEDAQNFAGVNCGTTDDSCFAGNYVFVGLEGTSGDQGKILQIQKNSLTTQTIINPGIGQSCFAVYFDGFYVWTGFNITPGQLVRIDPNTLATTTFTFPSSTGQNVANEIASDGNALYFTFYQAPALVSASLMGFMDSINQTMAPFVADCQPIVFKNIYSPVL